MSNRRRPKRAIYRVNLKLDYELDADLIAWMETQVRGTLSQAIREALRRGLTDESQIEQQTLDYEHIRAIVAAELVSALARQGFQARPSDDENNASETEDRYGSQLDRMLGGLSANVDPGDS